MIYEVRLGFCWLYLVNNHFTVRHIQVKHISGLDVSSHFDYGHQLRQVEEPGETGLFHKALALRLQFKASYGLPKGGCPIVKAVDTGFLQHLRLEVFLHDIKFCHGIGNRGAGCKDEAFVIGLLVDVLALIHQVICSNGIGCADACYVVHLGSHIDILEVMGFIHIEPINAKLFKIDRNIILVLFHFILGFFQTFLGLFQHQLHLLDGIPGILIGSKFIQHILVLSDTLLLQGNSAFRGDGDALKLGIAHNDSIPILGGNLGHKGLTVLLFKIAGLGHKNFGLGVELHKGSPSLLGEMFGHHHQSFLR